MITSFSLPDKLLAFTRCNLKIDRYVRIMLPMRKKVLPKKSLSQKLSQSKRSNLWLLSRLDYLWTTFFSDVEQSNPVFISFGRYSRLRLGSIRLEKTTNKSYITLSGMFKDESIPQEVIDHTIAHELCHYAHGFSSPKPRLHKYPHYGGIINKELRSRGLENLIKSYALWLKTYRRTL